MLDCRWLGMGGPGRVTELLLRGLADLEPAGRWVLWGPPSAGEFLWDGALHVRNHYSPKSYWGQREARGVPANDIAFYPHQIRPIRPGRSISLIHDTISIRYGGSAPARAVKRLYLALVAHTSSRIVTVSEHSRRSIERDLSIAPDKVTLIHMPVDADFVERVRTLRAEVPRRDAILAVGRFGFHKNLRRLILAFAQTALARRGGQLVLVGGSEDEVAELRAFASQHDAEQVTIDGFVPQAQLELLYASCRVVALPSLEEGFGLPAWEAIACGVPVCVSAGGSLPEVTRGMVETFSPTSVPEIAAALDRATAPEAGGEPLGAPFQAPSVGDFASSVVELVRAELAR